MDNNKTAAQALLQQTRAKAAIQALKTTQQLNPNTFIDEPTIVEPMPARLQRRVPNTNTNGALSIKISTLAALNHTQTLKYLDVQNNPRYKPRNNNTFCNIYAHDYAEHFGIYLPRVWWNTQTFNHINQNIDNPDFTPPTPIYNQNVIELNANALYNWLKECSLRPQHLSFGWTQTHPQEAQNAVNKLTHFAVICARRRERNRSGHITVIIPQHLHPQHNNKPQPITPIQSEAGTANRQITHNNLWYERNTYDAYGAFICPLPQLATAE
jgi:hypothetical protein